MPRNLQGPSANLGALDRVLGINEGGTDATTDLTAVQNLGGIHRSMINRPGGIAGLDALGRLPIDLIDADTISIQGPVLLNSNQVATYTITNYDTFTSYTISAITGTVSRVEDVITYTAPSANGTTGFRINDRVFDIAVGQTLINKPVIQSPVNLSNNLGGDVTFVTAPFDAVGGTDTHSSSSWQVSSDINFNTLIGEAVNSTINKISWTVTGLSENTTYYVRVKHTGVNSGTSGYSDIVQFSTKTIFLPIAEKQIVTANSKAGYTASAGENYGVNVVLSGDGQVMVTTSCKHDINLVANRAHEIGGDYADMYVKSGGTWSHVQRIQRPTGTSGAIKASLSYDGGVLTLGEHKFYDSEFTQANFSYSTPVSQSANLDGTTAVEIYNRVSGSNTWSLNKTISLNNNFKGYILNTDVKISGDGAVLVIADSFYGAAYKQRWNTPWIFNTAGANARALVYRKTASDWVLSQTLTIPNTLENTGSVSISRDGRTISVFDTLDESATYTNPAQYPVSWMGALHVYKDNGSGQFTLIQTLKSSTPRHSDHYGHLGNSVHNMSSDGKLLAAACRGVLAPNTNTWIADQMVAKNIQYSDGYGYVELWDYINGAYVRGQKLTPSGQRQYSHFGKSVWVSPNGKTIAVGAEYEDTKGTDAGMLYIFKKSDVTGMWAEVARVFPDSAIGNNEKFGVEVSLSDDLKEMAVGAWGRDPGLTKTATPIAQAGYGAVYLYG